MIPFNRSLLGCQIWALHKVSVGVWVLSGGGGVLSQVSSWANRQVYIWRLGWYRTLLGCQIWALHKVRVRVWVLSGRGCSHAVKFHHEHIDEFISGGWDDTVPFWDVRSEHSTRSVWGLGIIWEGVFSYSQVSSLALRRVYILRLGWYHSLLGCQIWTLHKVSQWEGLGYVLSEIYLIERMEVASTHLYMPVSAAYLKIVVISCPISQGRSYVMLVKTKKL